MNLLMLRYDDYNQRMWIQNIKDQLSPRLTQYLEPITFLLICLVSLKFALSWEVYRPEIDVYDEAWYIGQFPASIFEFFSTTQTGPLYRIWYQLLNRITDNPLNSYYLNGVILSFSIPVLFFLILKSLNLSTLVCMIGFLILCGYIPLYSVPRFVNNFSVLIFLVGGLVFIHQERPTGRLFTLSITFLLQSFIRPEAIVAFFGLLGFIWFYRGQLFVVENSIKGKIKATLFVSFIMLLPAYGLMKGAGNGSIVKSVYVLRDLFTLSGRGDADEFHVRFGHPNSILEAFLNNPKEYLIHLQWSLSDLFEKIQLISSLVHFQTLTFWFCFTLLLGSIFIHSFMASENSGLRIKNSIFLSLAVCGLLPTLVTSILFHSNVRYLLPLVLISIVLFCLSLPRLPQKPFSFAVSFLVAGFMLFPFENKSLSKIPEGTFYGIDAQAAAYCSKMRSAIEFMKSLEDRVGNSVQLSGIFQNEAQFFLKMKNVCNRFESCIDQAAQNTPSKKPEELFSQYDLIMFDPYLKYLLSQNKSSIVKESTKALMENYEAWGYGKIDFGCDTFLFVKKKVLKRGFE